MHARPLAEAARAIPAGARVFASPFCATPTTLLAALADRSTQVAGLSLHAGQLLGGGAWLDRVADGELALRSWQLSAATRRLVRDGSADYVPARARDVPRLLRGRVDVALVRVTPPDADGTCSLGPSASYSAAMLADAALRLAEVDPDLPRTRGDDVTVRLDDLDLLVDSAAPAPTVPSADPSDAARRIARHVAGLVGDGATVQLGIGAVPEAVADELSRGEAGDLRPVGLLTDAMTGLLTSDRVRHGPGSVRAVEILGERAAFEHADDNPEVTLHSSATVHDPAWLGRLPRLVSVCSGLEVDLAGQVASEQAGDRVIGGIGGAVDFFEGAGISPGGRRVVALGSRAPSGRSRVVARLAAPGAVTLPRHSVDLVVTEHGVADLRGLSLRERADALVDVADPDHREDLRAAAAGEPPPD